MGRHLWVMPLVLTALAAAIPLTSVKPVVATEAAVRNTDDPAIWVNARQPRKSLVLGTVKAASPHGALAVYNLAGRIVQRIGPLDRPNNVDVEYSFSLDGKKCDLAVVTERTPRRLRVFRISASGLTDVSDPDGLSVFSGEAGERAAPMGIALYRRPRDGAVFAIVSRKAGPAKGYLWQYRLLSDAGRVRAVKVREFGAFSGQGEIEAIAVDDELGYVYYADEGAGVRKYHADPDHPRANEQIAVIATAGWKGDREGIAVLARPGGAGYVICTDQLDGNSEYHVYARQGDQSAPLSIVSGGADATDGIEVTSANLGAPFTSGLFVAMNSTGNNFFFYRWNDLEPRSGSR